MTLSVGRPRSAGRRDLPDNLQPKPRTLADGSTVVYWYWRDPRDGVEKPLKCTGDKSTAIRRAKELNAIVAQELASKVVADLVASPKRVTSTPFDAFAVYYLSKLDASELASNTQRARKSQVNAAIRFFKDKPISEIGVPDIVELLDKLILEGKRRMAQAVRSTLIDMWGKAYAKGILPATHPNPAQIAERPTAKVKRARLVLDSFKTILKSSQKFAEKRGSWMPNSLLLGIVTGQRPSDLVAAQFRRGKDWYRQWEAYQLDPKKSPAPYPHVHEGFFWVVQQKTGALVKIPLSLRLDAIGMSAGEVIEQCRSRIASRYILHHTIPFGNAPLGSPISSFRIAHGFAEARDATELEWRGKEPPPYYEIRSLSERLYSDQGIDTQSLLGHKSARMTEVYADPRQAEWTTVGLRNIK